MTFLPLDNLAMAGSPAGWALVALLVVVVFAPRLLPIVGRVLGRLARMEAQRRLRMTLGPLADVVTQRPAPPPPPARTAAPAPTSPAPAARTPAEALIEVEPAPAPAAKEGRRRPGAPWWAVGLVVAGVVAVLSWFLLHAR